MSKWAFRGSKGDMYTKITSSAVETPITPAFTEHFANLTCLVIANTSASVAKVIIKDGIGGATRMVIEVLANDTKIIGDGDNVILEQLNRNTRWTATCTSVDSIEITATFKNN